MTFSWDLIAIGVVMILALIGMIACAKRQRTNPNAQVFAIGLLIIVMVCGAAILVKTGTFGGDSNESIIKNEMKFARSSSFVIGDEIKKSFPGVKVLAIVDRNFETNTRMKELVEGLKEGLGTPESVEVDTPVIASEANKVKKPGSPEDDFMLPLEEVMKPADFDNVLDKHPDCKVAVSFIGLPRDIAGLGIWSKTDGVKLALMNVETKKLKAAIQKGFIIALVTYIPGVNISEDPAPKDPKKAFDLRYLLITPKNVDEVANKHKDIF